MRYLKFALFSLCLVINVTYALDKEHLVWEKIPLTIQLPINQERLVQFPQAIKVMDQQLTSNVEILKVKDSLYMKAKEPFKEGRLIVQLLPDGEVIILNLKADEKIKNANPIIIEVDSAEGQVGTTSSLYEYNAIQLTRFAIQSLYSPERVLEIPEGIHRTPMQTHKTIPLFYGASVEAHPLASWRGGDLYVTAVEVKNLLSKSVHLQFSNLIGHWQAASFYPTNELMPRNHHESTTVFLVSEQPFPSALTQQPRFNR
ncbi:TIGR03749 family integrating conjugative element protein [Legionella septentrionalis]|uniref:TIGR03749 family integrating conjugative element protein n=1 Tax=Legionella septentrionalis TaxID=2498109 RepID=A0A3S0WZX5_9GAMM|nr:TIGR03749 family integrating conjugative element protein [Legionella septentrionalis]RUQ85134.1 TIGR03749 family integrating conjugative element protein [Legionella septentrionalis]